MIDRPNNTTPIRRYASRALAVGLAMIISNAQAMLITDTIVVGDREWAQVNLFSGQTWNQINAACPAGVCTGLLNGHDVGGWTWAAHSDVAALFVATTDYLGGNSTLFEMNSAWAPHFFNVVGFTPTATTPRQWQVSGHSSTAAGGSSEVPQVIDRFDPNANDVVCIGCASILVNSSFTSQGAWLFRAATVPEPGSLVLASLAILGLRFRVRR